MNRRGPHPPGGSCASRHRQEFRDWPNKAVTVFGMSGVGKTTLADLLQERAWFHYSVDYRIGTRYMGEHIVDNFKREAMRVPFLRDLLRSDSIYISSNITFQNLSPLSTYLGKPGNPDKGGIDFRRVQAPPGPASRRRDQRAPRRADFHRALARDLRLRAISSAIRAAACARWSIPTIFSDPVLQLPRRQHAAALSSRARPRMPACWSSASARMPKPMYYQPRFLDAKWAEYKSAQRHRR